MCGLNGIVGESDRFTDIAIEVVQPQQHEKS